MYEDKTLSQKEFDDLSLGGCLLLLSNTKNKDNLQLFANDVNNNSSYNEDLYVALAKHRKIPLKMQRIIAKFGSKNSLTELIKNPSTKVSVLLKIIDRDMILDKYFNNNQKYYDYCVASDLNSSNETLNLLSLHKDKTIANSAKETLDLKFQVEQKENSNPTSPHMLDPPEKNLLYKPTLDQVEKFKIAYEKLTKEMEKEMSKKTFLETTKEDAKAAAYRVAAKQMTKGTKAAVVKMLEGKAVDNNTVSAVKEIMETEIGTAGVGMLLGLMLNYIPQLSQDPRMQKLAEEFRIEGMATAGNAVIGSALENFMPVITEAMKALPAEEAVPKLRITNPAEDAHAEETEEKKEGKLLSIKKS